MTAKDQKKTIRHVEKLVIRLATGRASMIPIIRPLMTLPTTRPRVAADDRCAA
jgi:hypothetical protein